MTSIPRKLWRRGEGGDVLVTCPGCGLEAYLDHDVAKDGTVTPSLDCPKCPYHKFVKLEGWLDAGDDAVAR